MVISATRQDGFKNRPSIRIDNGKGNRDLKAIILDELASRERYRATTNLGQFKRQLIEQKYVVDDEEFVSVWKGFAQQGAGKIIFGTQEQADIFKWDLKLTEFAKAARAGLPIPKEASLAFARKPADPKRKGKPGRPKGAKNKTYETESVIERRQPGEPFPKNVASMPEPVSQPMQVRVPQIDHSTPRLVANPHVIDQGMPFIMLAVPGHVNPLDLQALISMIESLK